MISDHDVCFVFKNKADVVVLIVKCNVYHDMCVMLWRCKMKAVHAVCPGGGGPKGES